MDSFDLGKYSDLDENIFNIKYIYDNILNLILNFFN